MSRKHPTMDSMMTNFPLPATYNHVKAINDQLGIITLILSKIASKNNIDISNEIVLLNDLNAINNIPLPNPFAPVVYNSHSNATNNNATTITTSASSTSSLPTLQESQQHAKDFSTPSFNINMSLPSSHSANFPQNTATPSHSLHASPRGITNTDTLLHDTSNNQKFPNLHDSLMNGFSSSTNLSSDITRGHKRLKTLELSSGAHSPSQQLTSLLSITNNHNIPLTDSLDPDLTNENNPANILINSNSIGSIITNNNNNNIVINSKKRKFSASVANLPTPSSSQGISHEKLPAESDNNLFKPVQVKSTSVPPTSVIKKAKKSKTQVELPPTSFTSDVLSTDTLVPTINPPVLEGKPKKKKKREVIEMPPVSLQKKSGKKDVNVVGDNTDNTMADEEVGPKQKKNSGGKAKKNSQ